MIEQFATIIRPFLELPIVRRTRRNHALEHATIHMLSRRNRTLRMAGRSSDSGFVLIGDAPTEQIEDAVHEALRRMQDGESRWAIHPNCGTNLVTTGFVTTLMGYIGLRGGSNKPVSADRFSWTMVLVIFGLLVSRPLGMSLQKHITTKGDPGDLEVVDIKRREMGWFGQTPVTVHRVITRRG